MKILFYGTKTTTKNFLKSFFPPIRELKLNLQKQISMKKPHPLLMAMKQSALS